MADQAVPLHQTTCIGCAQTDDHPKHLIDLGGGDEVRWHTDCHLIAKGPGGCPDVCAPMRAGAEGLTGDEYRAHLTGQKGS